jgi:hypothetical protein
MTLEQPAADVGIDGFAAHAEPAGDFGGGKELQALGHPRSIDVINVECQR